LAGISIAFISMRPAAQMWEALWIALPVFAIIVIGFFTGRKLPGNIPIGLAALLVGTAIGWIGGYMSAPDVVTAAKDIAIGLPTLNVDLLVSGLSAVAPLLATAIPLGIYNFCEGMTNVESAAVAGDNYNLRSVLLADGTGAVVGAALGSPFPPAVYIGHPGWKEAGGRTTYSLASGVVIALMCFLGLFGLLGALIPLPAIVPILLYIGLLIGAQAFVSVPKAHAVGRRPGGDSQRCGLGDRPDRQRAERGRHQRDHGRQRRAGPGRGCLRRPEEPRRRGHPGRHGARRDRSVHDRQALLLGSRVLRGRDGAVVHRPDPRRAGGVGGQSWCRAGLPPRGGGLPGVLLRQHAGTGGDARRACISHRQDPCEDRGPRGGRRTDAVICAPEAPLFQGHTQTREKVGRHPLATYDHKEF
ncbi:MAG: hypothetical protein ACRDS9_28510, partial [Pseudonocardiaceae bacterium]